MYIIPNLQEVSKINIAYVVYTIVDDVLKALGHKFDCRQKMTDSEVITTGILAALLFGGNFAKCRKILFETGLIPDMLEQSRFNRRIHALSDVMETIFLSLGSLFKESNVSMEYVIDSFPVPVCDNIRISRSKLVKSEKFRGYCASKRRYFYGVKVQVIATADGIPVEVSIIPGSYHDSKAYDVLEFDLPWGSIVYSDNAFENYELEDLFLEALKIKLDPQRKKVSNRQDEYIDKLYKNRVRKMIETVFSGITGLFPKKIHAVSIKGFLLKIFLFILGYSIEKVYA